MYKKICFIKIKFVVTYTRTYKAVKLFLFKTCLFVSNNYICIVINKK